MKTFKTLVNEMGDIVGELPISSYSKKDEFKHYLNKATLLLDNLGSEHYKFYKFNNTYFLTDENSNYLGYIQGNISKINNKNFYKIGMSSSDLNNGFYKIMFTCLFATQNIDYILSDNQLSLNAVKSYENLLKYGYFKVEVFDGKNFFEFSREKYKESSSYVLAVSEKVGSKGRSKEVLENFHKKIKDPFFYPIYERRDRGCNALCFCISEEEYLEKEYYE